MYVYNSLLVCLVVLLIFYRTRINVNLIFFFITILHESIFWSTEKPVIARVSVFLRLFVFVGGYETFYSEYPECCVDVKPISQEKIESERALLSQCGKPVPSIGCRPAYDQVCDFSILVFFLGTLMPPFPAWQRRFVLCGWGCRYGPPALRASAACQLDFPSKDKWASFQQMSWQEQASHRMLGSFWRKGEVKETLLLLAWEVLRSFRIQV